MNNNEQVPEGDLFKWGEQHSRTTAEIKFASPDDDLGWTCPQCELFGHLCPACAAKQKTEQEEE